MNLIEIDVPDAIGIRVSATIVDEAGAAIAGARVSQKSTLSGFADARFTVTDDDGAFEFQATSPGSVLLIEAPSGGRHQLEARHVHGRVRVTR